MIEIPTENFFEKLRIKKEDIVAFEFETEGHLWWKQWVIRLRLTHGTYRWRVPTKKDSDILINLIWNLL